MPTTIFEQQLETIGKTRQQIASELRVSRMTVSNWLTGRSFPRRRMAKRVAKAFGMTPEQLAQQSLASGTLK